MPKRRPSRTALRRRARAEQRDFAERLVGRTLGVLIEKTGRPGQRVGRSPWLQPVVLDETAGEIGDIVEARITRAGQQSLFAEPGP